MSGAAISPGTSMQPDTCTVPVTPSSNRMSPVKTGGGAISTSCSWMQPTGRCAAPAPTPCREEEPIMKGDDGVTTEMPTGDLLVPVAGQDHVQGPDTAPVTLVEYADYE